MTKNEILASILPLASKEGLRNLSLSKIAENAGIAKSTLYSHFDSKDDMIDQLYLFLREKAKERMHIGVVDYGKIVKGKSLEEVLLYVVSSYDSINRDRDMKNFYFEALHIRNFCQILFLLLFLLLNLFYFCVLKLEDIHKV